MPFPDPDPRPVSRASLWITGLLVALGTLGTLYGWGEQVSAALGGDGRFTCTVDRVIDGDSFVCLEPGADGKQLRIRLSGVAARERDGTCSPGHPCPDASAEAATEALAGLIEGEALRCRDVGKTYNRVAAWCELPDGRDLSCAMVASGTTLRWDRYWKDGPRC